MKFVGLLALLSLTTTAWADFTAYTQMDDLKVLNESGQLVYEGQSSTLKNADLRENIAALQSTFNTLTVVDKSGTLILDQEFAENFSITSSYISTLANGIFKVFNHQGQAFINESWVKAQGISNTMFAYREDRAGSLLVVLNEQGQEIFTVWNNLHAKISDNFLFAEDIYGSLVLFDKSGKRLHYSNGFKNYELSDSYAAITDNYDFTQIFNRQGEVLISGYGMTITNLLNDLISYDQNGQTFITNSKKEKIFWASIKGQVSLLDSGFVYRDNSGYVRFMNQSGMNSYSTMSPKTYFLTNNLLGYQSSEQNITIFNFENFKIFEEFNPSLAQVIMSSSMFAIRSQTANGLRVYDAKATLLVDELNVQNAWISTTTPNLNWNKF
jgi:hypothetical protein